MDLRCGILGFLDLGPGMVKDTVLMGNEFRADK